MTAHSICNDGVGVKQLSQLSSYVVLEVVEISHACFVHLVLQYSPTHFSQLDLNPANLEATVEAE